VFLIRFAVREPGSDAANTEIVFHLASVSKPIAATVDSAVVGDDTLAWNSHIDDVDLGFTLHEIWSTQEVTLSDLFAPCIAHCSRLTKRSRDVLGNLGFARGGMISRLSFIE
jgi:hypothetical protein